MAKEKEKFKSAGKGNGENAAGQGDCYIQERFLDCAPRRAETARRKKARGSARNDGAKTNSRGKMPRLRSRRYVRVSETAEANSPPRWRRYKSLEADGRQVAKHVQRPVHARQWRHHAKYWCRAQHAVPLRRQRRECHAGHRWRYIQERFLDCVSRRFAQMKKRGTLRSE